MNKKQDPKDQEQKLKLQNLYTLPAQISAAQKHRNANKYGYRDSQSDSKGDACDCCNMKATIQLPMNYNTTPLSWNDILRSNEEDIPKNQDKYKLSVGISLFFSFIKMAIYYLILRFIFTDAYNIYTSVTAGTFCSSNQCDSLLEGKLSSYNKIEAQNLVKFLDVLNIVTLIASIFFFNYHRRLQYKIEKVINQSQHSEDDYTILLTRIPYQLLSQAESSLGYKEILENYLEDKLKQKIDADSGFQRQIQQILQKATKNKDKREVQKEVKKIARIIICYNLEEFQTLQKIKINLMKDIVALCKQGQRYEQLQKRLHLVIKEQINLSKAFSQNRQNQFNLTHFVGRAFVIFELQHFRDYFLDEFEKDNNFLKIQNKVMRVNQAGAPTDILWFNMKVASHTRQKYILFSFAILIMILVFAFFAILWATKAKHDIGENVNPDDDIMGWVLTIGMTIFTLFINFFLGAVMKILTQYECHQTKSDHIVSLVIKVAISQFLNTAINYYVSCLIIGSPYMSEDGLVVQVSSLFITSAVIQIVLNFLNINSLIVEISRCLKNRKNTVDIFQRDLNKQFQKAEFDVVDRYSYYILQIYVCSFYSYLTPIATPCLILAFTFQYWIDKYNLFKRSSCKNEMDFFLSRTMFKILEGSLVAFAIGNYLFGSVLQDNYLSPVNLAAIIITIAYVLIVKLMPLKKQKQLFSSRKVVQKHTYTEFRQTVGPFYWQTNPATKYGLAVDSNDKKGK